MIRRISAFLVVSSIASFADADQFHVDLFGIDAGHSLQVSGTIDIDLTTDSVLNSSLQFFHESDPAVQLPSIPTQFNGGVDFVVDMDMLYLEAGMPASLPGSLQWESSTPSGSRTFVLGARDRANEPFALINLNDALHGSRRVMFSGIGGRLNIGTAVPEPSTVVIGFSVVFAAVAARWSSRCHPTSVDN